MQWHYWSLLALTTLTLDGAPFPLHSIEISGNKRYPSEAIAKASGLILSKAYEASAFDSASGELGKTGLFQSVRFRYDPVTIKNQPGFRLTFEVVEAPTVRVIVDIPGAEPAAFWKKMSAGNGLIVAEMTDGAQAQAYYESEISRILGSKVVFRLDGNLRTGSTVALLQLEDAPVISGVKFTGDSAVSREELTHAVRALPGNKYSPHYVRRAVEASLRPLFDNRGLLKAEFAVKDVPAGPGVPEVVIQQGAVYQLRQAGLLLNGAESPELLKIAAFATGKAAEWDKIEAASERALKELRKEGYLAPRVSLKRDFDAAAPQVDLMLNITRGNQFLFKTLTLEGVTSKQDAAARKSWKLAPGTPFDAEYAGKFAGQFAGELDAVEVATELKADGLMVEYIVKIRPKP